MKVAFALIAVVAAGFTAGRVRLLRLRPRPAAALRAAPAKTPSAARLLRPAAGLPTFASGLCALRPYAPQPGYAPPICFPASGVRAIALSVDGLPTGPITTGRALLRAAIFAPSQNNGYGRLASCGSLVLWLSMALRCGLLMGCGVRPSLRRPRRRAGPLGRPQERLRRSAAPGSASRAGPTMSAAAPMRTPPSIRADGIDDRSSAFTPIRTRRSTVSTSTPPSPAIPAATRRWPSSRQEIRGGEPAVRPLRRQVCRPYAPVYRQVTVTALARRG